MSLLPRSLVWGLALCSALGCDVFREVKQGLSAADKIGVAVTTEIGIDVRYSQIKIREHTGANVQRIVRLGLVRAASPEERTAIERVVRASYIETIDGVVLYVCASDTDCEPPAEPDDS